MLLFPLEISTQTLWCRTSCELQCELVGWNWNRRSIVSLCLGEQLWAIHGHQPASWYAISLSTHICYLPCTISDLFFHVDNMKNNYKPVETIQTFGFQILECCLCCDSVCLVQPDWPDLMLRCALSALCWVQACSRGMLRSTMCHCYCFTLLMALLIWKQIICMFCFSFIMLKGRKLRTNICILSEFPVSTVLRLNTQWLLCVFQ